jgi:hypothetical protein
MHGKHWAFLMRDEDEDGNPYLCVFALKFKRRIIEMNWWY